MVLGMINEIQQYLDARYIGPLEAAWRIFGHPLHAEMPTVVRLALHLPGMHRVVKMNVHSLIKNFHNIMFGSSRKRDENQEKGDLQLNCIIVTGRRSHCTFNIFGHIVITVASSRIASLLLVGGRTAHSTFSIPLDVLENSNCGLSKQLLQAELFRETKLIIWDEVPMQHRHCVEAVDRTLRDICDSDKPFGGITVVLGGDFRQILPVIPKGFREQIVNASLRHSILWKHIHILTLDLNMRLNHEDRENANFANFVMEIGTNHQEIANLPSTIHKCQDLNELLSTVYPRLNIIETSTPTYLTEHTILSARNDDVSDINTTALNIFPGRLHTYLAEDKMSEDNEVYPTITNRYPNEYLNSLDPPGLPTFKLELKVGCPIILLRNIAPKDRLCNGTRLMVTRCNTRIIEAQILTGEKFGNLAFIPRISLAPSSSEMPFQMTRR
ncbi:uncharacterized protein LOC127788170 [Diospyros lotus]|uniref:uncharacterized protein LOC127788170 n=1 Tax=Diospyros lotus TaxID=55363 RepID=UPI002250E2A2|nr:uncharacterized protein LOC127788170 [Diospyros lotus]